GLQCRAWAGKGVDRTVRRSVRPESRSRRLGGAHPIHGNPQLCAARNGESAGLSHALRRQRAAHNRHRPATQRCDQLTRAIQRCVARPFSSPAWRRCYWERVTVPAKSQGFRELLAEKPWPLSPPHTIDPAAEPSLIVTAAAERTGRNLVHLRICHLSGGNGWGLLVLLEVLGHCRSRDRAS